MPGAPITKASSQAILTLDDGQTALKHGLGVMLVDDNLLYSSGWTAIQGQEQTTCLLLVKTQTWTGR